MTIMPETSVKILPMIIIASVSNCERCRKNHVDMLFTRFANPSEQWTHWGLCPELHEPIFIKRGKEKIKVFRINEYEWWAGESLETILPIYLQETGVSKEEAFVEPYELDDHSMDSLIYHDDDGQTRTFREQLEKVLKDGVPCPFAFAFTEG